MTVKFIDLGWITARFDEDKGRMLFLEPSSMEDHFKAPACSIDLVGRHNLIKLRDALVIAYPLTKDV